MKKKVILIAIIGVLTLGYFGAKRFMHPAMPAFDPVIVKTSAVRFATLPQEVHAIGTLTARSVEITPEMAGHVQKILFQDGAFVKQGTPLIQLDDAVYQAKHASAKAKLTYSDNNYHRMVLLGKHNAIAKQAIDQAEADLKERKAEADESEVMLHKMKLEAPFDGVVGKCRVNPGDYVTIGQSIVTVTDTKHLRVEYNVPDKFLPRLHVGQTIQLTTAAYPDKTFTGTVSFISPTINTENRSIALYADIENDQNLLAPGMFVDVVQSLGTEERIMMIPSRSLVPILDGEQVFKVVEGKAFAVTVGIGKRSLDDVQVTQGLAEGDVIITDGQLKLRNGMPIKIQT